MDKVLVKIRKLENFDGLALPEYKTGLAAGADLRAAIATPLILAPGERTLIPAGFSMALPAGYEAQIRPRSGLACKHGISILNTPGTIDADYRGEIKILLVNHGPQDFTVNRGDRIAQIVIAPVIQAKFETVAGLSATKRGAGGYGSTGLE